MYYLSLIIAALSGTMYHISQKSINPKVSPYFSIIISYLVALVLSLILFYFDKNRVSITASFRELNWASYGVGIAIVGIELSFLLAYRSGWDIGKMNLAYTLILTLILVPLGMMFFKEHHSFRTFIGIGVSIIGLLIMKI